MIMRAQMEEYAFRHHQKVYSSSLRRAKGLTRSGNKKA
jgi:hypothetical protein